MFQQYTNFQSEKLNNLGIPNRTHHGRTPLLYKGVWAAVNDHVLIKTSWLMAGFGIYDSLFQLLPN